MRPGLRAVRRGADCKIAIEARLQAMLPRARCGLPKLPVREPLAEKSELKSRAVALDRMIDRLGVLVAQTLGPEPPILAGVSLGGRLEGGEMAQGFATASCEGVVVGDQR